MDLNPTDPPEPQNPVYETEEPVLYEAADGVAWVTMSRPAFNNVQNSQMTYALDDAFRRALDDDAVKVIVLKATGKHFSAGHDIGTLLQLPPRTPGGSPLNTLDLRPRGSSLSRISCS